MRNFEVINGDGWEMLEQQVTTEKRKIIRRKRKAILAVICSVTIIVSVSISAHKISNIVNPETKSVVVATHAGQATTYEEVANGKLRKNLKYIDGKGWIQSVEKEIPDTAPNYTAGSIRGSNPLSMTAKSNPNLIFINGTKKNKVVALTFDDGPDNTNTPKLLDILKEQGVKVTFFFIGKKVDGCEKVIERAYEEGHLIGGHTYNHSYLTKISSNQAEDELTKVDDKIYSVIGRKIVFIRPPCGDINQQVGNIYTKHKYKAVLWSIDTRDWENHNKNMIISNVVSRVSTSDIILLHMDGAQAATLEAMPEVIKNLKDKGYSFERVDQLLEIKGYQD